MIQGSKIWWILWFLGNQIFWIFWISCVATHSLISKDKSGIASNQNEKWNYVRLIHSACSPKQIHANDIRINQTTNFCFPFFFFGGHLLTLAVFKKDPKRETSVKIPWHQNWSQHPHSGASSLTSQGTAGEGDFFAGRDLCQETIFGERHVFAFGEDSKVFFRLFSLGWIYY